MMTPDDIQVRRDICQGCKLDCPERATISHADPCEACPRRVWHAWGDCARVTAPTPAEMAANAARSGARWMAAGLPIVSRSIYRVRLTLCRACPHWSDGARLGLGKCNAPGCGCTKLKLRLATERCPLNPPRWERIPRPAQSN
jgi:hypothetical protein